MMNPKVFSLALIALSLFSYFHSFWLTFVDIIFLFVVALATALARVAALEAELKTTTEALKDANTAKVSADKAAKAAETKAKKAEKALAEATQKQAKREQAVVERLDEICTSVGSKCFVLSLCLAKVTSVNMLLLTYLYFCDAAEKPGEVWKLRQESAKDPLLDVVEVL
jgi:ABC-type transport system involved in cytochrome bd biosynthesis fused ATPase/permease subunit